MQKKKKPCFPHVNLSITRSCKTYPVFK